MGPVEAAELVARFVLDRSKIAREDGYVKWAAFLPARDGKTSVFRTAGLTPAEVWRLGREMVAHLNGKPLRGWGEVSVSKVEEAGLSIEADDIPERHANLVGWPDEKQKQRAIALKLQRDARLFHQEVE